MIDTFALAITHALLALCAWRLMKRPDLDRDKTDPPVKNWGGNAAPGQSGQRPDA